MKLHDAIGAHNEEVIDKNANPVSDTMYNDCFHIDPDDDVITYPWDDDWKDVPLHDETEQTQQDLDKYTGRQLVLHDGEGNEVLCRVKGRKRHSNGTQIGEYNPNPILDTRLFDVEYPDGRVEAFTTNKIAEALYSNVDDQGFTVGLLKEIVDHEGTHEAIPKEEGFVGNTKKPVITTRGWKVKVKWCDGSYDWLPMAQVKNSNPVEMAEYAHMNNLQDEPAFRWWTRHVMKKKTRMINKIKTRMRKGPMKTKPASWQAFAKSSFSAKNP